MGKPVVFNLEKILQGGEAFYLEKFKARKGDLIISKYSTLYVFKVSKGKYHAVTVEDGELKVEIYEKNYYEVIPESAMTEEEKKEYRINYEFYHEEAMKKTNFSISSVPGVYFSDN